MKGKYKEIKKPARLGFMSYLGDTQGCGTIRVIYPFFYLNHYRKEKVSVHSAYLMNYIQDVMWYQPFTFVQFQRSATEQHLQLIQNFKATVQKKFPIPVIYEIDDMLFNIPKWNYASLYYNNAEDIIKKIMGNVDAMIVSTTRLKEEYSPYCKNISVIPNHLPKFVWGDVFPAHEYKKDKEKVKILWGGSQNHFSMKEVTKGVVGGDFGNELQNFIRKTTDVYEWNFIGALPEELNDVKQKVKFHPWENIFEYPKKLKSIEPDICIAPLVINDFNSCKCLTGNSLVVTDNGITTIDNLNYENRIWQEFSYKKIIANVKYDKRKTIKIRTSNGFEIEGTENHRIRSNGEFICLSDMNIDDYIDLSFFNFPEVDYQNVSGPFLLSKKLDSVDMENINEDMLPKITINERWGRFLGYVMGDGHSTSKSSAVGISCNKDYIDIIDDILLFAKEIGLKITPVEKVKKDKSHGYRNGKGIDLKFNSRNLKWILNEKIGFKGSNGKKSHKVPEVIFKSPKSVIREFIRGLFETDGTIGNTNCSLSQKSFTLIKQVQFLLLGFGIISKIHKRKVGGRYYYNLILNRQACDIFYKEINFISEKKKERLKEITEKEHSNAYKEWELKDKIVDIKYNENDVYDVQVPDGEYYLANGIVSHNSNIKCLEYNACGAVGVYSDIAPYKFMSYRAKTDEEMIAHIELLAGDIDRRARAFKKDFNRVSAQMWWESDNNIEKYINTYLKLFGQCL